MSSKCKNALYELTEDEISNFIAHSDDENGDGGGSDGSDWDDIGEADLSTILTNPKTDGHLKVESRRVSKEVNINHMFASIPSNIPATIESNEKEISMKELFGSDCLSDEDDGFEQSSLSVHGVGIQRILSNCEQNKRNKQIEREVDCVIEKAALVEKVSTSSSKVGNDSVSISLAACAAKRKKALAELNANAVPTFAAFNHHYHHFDAQEKLKHNPTSKLTNVNESGVDGCWTVAPTKLRVYRTLISSELWANRTSDRQVFNLSQLIHKIRSQDQKTVGRKGGSDELVVVGVIGSKIAPRRSRNDKIYSVWCLSDLEHVGPGSIGGCVKLFLFGSCHEKLWKESEGRVVALLNPRPLPGNSFSDSKDVSVTLESAMHVMILGESPDYGVCASTTKTGQSCFHIINKSISKYCDFHVKKAYYEASCSRPGFVSSSLPQFGTKPFRKYRGDMPPSKSQPGVYQLPISRNFQLDEKSTISTGRTKLSMAKLKNAGYEVDISVGLANQSACQKSNQSSSNNNLNEAEEKLIGSLRRPTAGSLNLLKHLEQEDGCVESDVDSRLNVAKAGEHKTTSTFASFFASMSKSSQSTEKGTDDGFIDLGPIPVSCSAGIIMSNARLRAISLVKSSGGVKAMEAKDRLKRRASVGLKATCDGQQLSSFQQQGPTAQRYNWTAVLADGYLKGIQMLGVVAEITLTKNHPISSKRPLSQIIDKDSASPHFSKRPCLELDQVEQRRLERLAKLSEQIKKGSAHRQLVDDLDRQTEDARLGQLERRDDFEEKLTNQCEEPCSFVCCQTCNYRAFKAAPSCKTDNHKLKFMKGFKRYFRCRNCQKRTITLDRYPTKSCSGCGESLFEKTGILAKKTGPSLPNEKLLTRGFEEKFLS